MSNNNAKIVYSDTVVVAHVIDGKKVVINKGKSQGIEVGMTYLFIADGPTITDPVSGKDLGQLELVRGTGKVIYCQENISTVESTVRKAKEKPRNMFLVVSVLDTVEYEDLPFDGIEVGDVGRPV